MLPAAQSVAAGMSYDDSSHGGGGGGGGCGQREGQWDWHYSWIRDTAVSVLVSYWNM